MPHNSLLFWKKLLRKRLPPGCLSQLKYTCFGLGDSTYVKYGTSPPFVKADTC
jgi:sulfite reductase alpha subunit-like flavoprotein